jgi:hypothetical protein
MQFAWLLFGSPAFSVTHIAHESTLHALITCTLRLACRIGISFSEFANAQPKHHCYLSTFLPIAGAIVSI